MRLQGPAQQGLQDQADEAEQLQGVLPQRIDRAAYALQQQEQHRALGFLYRDAVVLNRAVDVLEQGAAGSGQLLSAVRQALRAQQLSQ
ncbi:hypothetical protein D3C79_849080 [compost metagenome]